MEKVNEAGQSIGFSILKVSALKGQPPSLSRSKSNMPNKVTLPAPAYLHVQ